MKRIIHRIVGQKAEEKEELLQHGMYSGAQRGQSDTDTDRERSQTPLHVAVCSCFVY